MITTVPQFQAALVTLRALDIPANTAIRPANFAGGDVVPAADGSCPAGNYNPTPVAVASYFSAQQLCRPMVTLSTNGLQYASPPGIADAIWLLSVANAAAHFYDRYHPGQSPPSDPEALRPFLDQANAWYWGRLPGWVVTGLPWGDVPWEAIGGDTGARWAWVRDVGPNIDWDAVDNFLAGQTLTATNDAAGDWDWMARFPPVLKMGLGFQNASVLNWKNDPYASEVPWRIGTWEKIPWSVLPWRAIDWSTIATTADLLAALQKLTALPAPALDPNAGSAGGLTTIQPGLVVVDPGGLHLVEQHPGLAVAPPVEEGMSGGAKALLTLGAVGGGLWLLRKLVRG